jgi:hypothetical protein
MALKGNSSNRLDRDGLDTPIWSLIRNEMVRLRGP